MSYLPHFSIVVPTYHEAESIAHLIHRIANVDFGQHDFEVIIVDDNSNDGTIEIIRSLVPHFPWLKCIVREGKRDLSQSIITGFKNASSPIIITMDADLSHPPEKIPMLLSALADPEVDMVIGSRYVEGGSVDFKWPLLRKWISLTAAALARAFLFAKVKDPLSGFIALRKSTFMAGGPIYPIGWKIGLEIMVKCQCKKIREVPIHFSQRALGSSKLNYKISFDYLLHLIHLLRYQIGHKLSHKK